MKVMAISEPFGHGRPDAELQWRGLGLVTLPVIAPMSMDTSSSTG